MFHILRRRFSFLIGVGLISFILPFLFSGCGEKPKITSFQTVPPVGEVEVGGEIHIEATMEPTELQYSFKWIPDAGEVRVPTSEVSSGVYIAPKKAGTYLVRIQAFYQGKKVDEKSISIKVKGGDVGETDVLEPTSKTAPPAEADSSKYGFEAGTMGWRRQVVEGNQAVKKVAQTTEKAYRGSGSLKLTVDLKGGHENDSKGEAFRELRPPVNLQGKTITAWVYAPAGSAGDFSLPNGVQVFVKDRNFKSLYGTWINILEENWFDVSLTVSTTKTFDGYIDKGFDPQSIVMVGIKVAIGDGSKETYSGPIYVDAVDW